MAVLRTNEANCRDCYACVRACPVKAIRVSVGHAEVVPELCILDGACVAACPQGAKQAAEHGSRVEEYFGSGHSVAFTLAPSVAAAYNVAPGTVAAALRRAGAVAVGETAETSGWVSRRHWELAQQRGSVLSSSCPAVVNLITTYYPGALSYLAEVVSPMVAHGRAIKQALGPATRVVFAGPCIAKKGECLEESACRAIDAVLTLPELSALLDRLVPDWEELAPEPFDRFTAQDEAWPHLRRFPLPGGMKELFGTSQQIDESSLLVVTGVKQCMELLTDIPVHGVPARVVEMMACVHGCIGGPALCGKTPMHRRRQRVHDYASAGATAAGIARAALRYGEVDLDRRYCDRRPHLPQPSEEEIRAILASIGKRQVADELNCGACGYESCREKAVAVFRGMAEREMCIPYMRSKAESMAEVVLATTPTSIVVINRSLHVLALNPAAERLFGCRAGDYVGRPLWRLFDPVRVERVFASQRSAGAVVRHEKQGRVVREHLVYDHRNDLVIALMTDITDETRRQEEFAALRQATLDRAQEVIDRQMRVAQEIASLLGETTAETKVILTQLMRLFNEGGQEGGEASTG